MTKRKTKEMNAYYDLIDEFNQKKSQHGLPVTLNCTVSVWKRSWKLNAWYKFVNDIESRFNIINYDYAITATNVHQYL